MSDHPSSIATKERWIAISNDVPDKTPKDCFMRYKSIVAKMKLAASQ